MNQVIGIRTNCWTAAEEQTYQRLREAFLPEQIFVVADETKAEVLVPEGVQKIGWNKAFMTQIGVLDYDHFGRGIGWLCGDYFYYAFHQAVVADYYWLIEPDVGMSFPSWQEHFFAKFEHHQADGLFANLRFLPESDYWHQSARLISEATYGCSFPLNRLSSAAIQQCLIERQRLSQLFRSEDCRSNTHNPLGVHFPNDEALVVTTLKRDGFAVHDFREVLPDQFDFFGYHHVFAWPSQGGLRPAHQIIHPVRPLTAIVEKLFGELLDDLQKNDHLSWVTVAPEDALAVGEQVGKLLGTFIGADLAKRSRFLRDFAELQQLVRQEATRAPYPCRFWVYQSQIFVLDMMVNGEEVTTEYVLDKGYLTCYTFHRTKPDWGDEFAARYPDLSRLGHKVNQFTLPVPAEMAELRPLIEQSLRRFFDMF